MFLHLGRDLAIPVKEVIGIFALDSNKKNKDTSSFLQVTQEEGFVTHWVKGEANSFVLTTKGVYLSSISSTTLGKRMREKLISKKELDIPENIY